MIGHSRAANTRIRHTRSSEPQLDTARTVRPSPAPVAWEQAPRPFDDADLPVDAADVWATSAGRDYARAVLLKADVASRAIPTGKKGLSAEIADLLIAVMSRCLQGLACQTLKPSCSASSSRITMSWSR